MFRSLQNKPTSHSLYAATPALGCPGVWLAKKTRAATGYHQRHQLTVVALPNHVAERRKRHACALAVVRAAASTRWGCGGLVQVHLELPQADALVAVVKACRRTVRCARCTTAEQSQPFLARGFTHTRAIKQQAVQQHDTRPNIREAAGDALPTIGDVPAQGAKAPPLLHQRVEEHQTKRQPLERRGAPGWPGQGLCGARCEFIDGTATRASAGQVSALEAARALVIAVPCNRAYLHPSKKSSDARGSCASERRMLARSPCGGSLVILTLFCSTLTGNLGDG